MTYLRGKGPEHTLKVDEEVIGIYGWYDDTEMKGLGIIVWIPPKY